MHGGNALCPRKLFQRHAVHGARYPIGFHRIHYDNEVSLFKGWQSVENSRADIQYEDTFRTPLPEEGMGRMNAHTLIRE